MCLREEDGDRHPKGRSPQPTPSSRHRHVQAIGLGGRSKTTQGPRCLEASLGGEKTGALHASCEKTKGGGGGGGGGGVGGALPALELGQSPKKLILIGRSPQAVAAAEVGKGRGNTWAMRGTSNGRRRAVTGYPDLDRKGENEWAYYQRKCFGLRSESLREDSIIWRGSN